MNFGRMRHRIEFQEPVKVKDGYGGVTTTYTTRRTCWSDISPLNGKEAFRYGKIDMRVTHTVKIFYYSSLVPSWRLKFGTRYFNILSMINDEENNKSMTLFCEEVVNG